MHPMNLSVSQFRELNALPTPIHFEANESAASFAMHNASWYKSCYLKYNSSKLAKVKKRSVCESDYDFDRSRSKCNTCLFVKRDARKQAFIKC